MILSMMGGRREYDDFRAAFAPGLLAADQTVRFQFGFFLEMSGRPGLQLFRSAD